MNALLKESVVRLVPLDIARGFVEKWHYSNCVPTGRNMFLGWFIPGQPWGDLFGEGLYAVADYGVGVNPYQAQFLSDLTDHLVQNDTLVELKRLCRREPKIKELPLTAFLSRCHKKLRVSGIEYVVAFSDPTYGHNGGIYRAANFQHLGQTNSEMHVVDRDGVVRHRRYAYRYARRNGVPIGEAREILGLTPYKTLPKDRWFVTI